MELLDTLDKRTTASQRHILEINNDLAKYKVKIRAELASMEHNIRLLQGEIEKLKDKRLDDEHERDAIALVLDETVDKVKKLKPKSLWDKIIGR